VHVTTAVSHGEVGCSYRGYARTTASPKRKLVWEGGNPYWKLVEPESTLSLSVRIVGTNPGSGRAWTFS